MSAKRRKLKPIPLVAMALAWLVPGAGHVYMGRVTRGLIVFVVIGATFWSGVAIGGVLTVDSYGERWWFVADMFAGVHGLVGWYRQKLVYDDIVGELPGDELFPPGAPQSAVQEPRIQAELADRGLAMPTTTAAVARVYAGVAGLLNLMCIFDAVVLVLMGRTGESAPDPTRQQEQAA